MRLSALGAFAGAFTLGLILTVAPRVAAADAGWFDASDLQLRTDLQLLNDAEVIRYPVTLSGRCRETASRMRSGTRGSTSR